MTRNALLLFYSLCFGMVTQAQAQAPDRAYDLPKVVAVEPRAFNPRYDVTAYLGVLPIDAFWKGISTGFSYTQGFKSAWNWEVINANLSFKSDTNLKRDLVENFNVRPQGILDHITWFATTSAVYTPIYSKNLLANSALMHGSFSGVVGAGGVGFSNGDIAPIAGGGIILRAFHNARLSSKLDGRLYYHFAQKKSSDMLLVLSYGLSFELGDNRTW